MNERKQDRPSSSKLQSSMLNRSIESNSINEEKLSFVLSLKNKSNQIIRLPDQINEQINDPPHLDIDEDLLDRIQGSICGLAIGDALGAHVEFRPREYLEEHPVRNIEGGGTWGLEKGKWTDDTSMALCLAISLINENEFNLYDQMIRYKWWYRDGYMSSTGHCFDIGAATSLSLEEFEKRQKEFYEKNNFLIEKKNEYFDEEIMRKFNVYCSSEGVAGNGALMRLAPVPLFFFRNIFLTIEFSGRSAQITHGDDRARDAARYLGALIAAILRGKTKDQILHSAFYIKHQKWFGNVSLHDEIINITKGSFKKSGGYNDGIRGKGFVVQSLEAALWAFWSTKNFKDGALAAVNLGDDTDTTAAIYGQLAGAYYGYKNLPKEWLKDLYAKDFLLKLSKWILYRGEQFEKNNREEFERFQEKH